MKVSTLFDNVLTGLFAIVFGVAAAAVGKSEAVRKMAAVREAYRNR